VGFPVAAVARYSDVRVTADEAGAAAASLFPSITLSASHDGVVAQYKQTVPAALQNGRQHDAASRSSQVLPVSR